MIEFPDNIIELKEHRAQSPILRKGDLVRLQKMQEFVDEADCLDPDHDWDADNLNGATGIVTSIELKLPDDHPTAPGQAMYATIAVPHEEGWEEIGGLSIYHMVRILGPDAEELRECQG